MTLSLRPALVALLPLSLMGCSLPDEEALVTPYETPAVPLQAHLDAATPPDPRDFQDADWSRIRIVDPAPKAVVLR